MKKIQLNISLFKTFTLGLLVTMAVSSCKKEKHPAGPKPATPITYAVPVTYNFASPDTLSTKQRIAMLAELTGVIKKTHSNTAAPLLDAQKLKDLYANVGGKFADATLNSSGVQLKDQTGSAFGLPAEMEANFEDAVLASQAAAVKADSSTASNGKAGKLINGTRYVLVDKNGFEYKEFVEKGLMGGIFYYQGTTLLNTIATFDNTTVTGGTTAQERAWDQAFGYFGVPADFPTNITGLKNWGSYCNNVSVSLGGSPTVNQTIMNAFLKGRAAISNKDNAGRDAARKIVVETWEKVCAARFITYVKGAKTNVAAPATFCHNLSEGVGFIHAFKYNSAKTISDADIETLLGYFKTAGTVNFYTVTTANLDNAIAKMASLFNLDASLL